MKLWIHWWNAVVLLRPACSRARTFMWFVTCIAGFTTRTDMLGVSSMIRSLGLHARYYNNLLNNFHSQGIKLDKMTRLWVKIVMKLFLNPVLVNERMVLVGDGIKTERGLKRKGVSSLIVISDDNTYIQYSIIRELTSFFCGAIRGI